MTKHSVCKSAKNVKSKFCKIFTTSSPILLRANYHAKFVTICLTGEKRRVPQRLKVKRAARNPANSKREHENQKQALANGIRRNDLVDEKDVEYSDLITPFIRTINAISSGPSTPYSKCSATSNIFKCYIFLFSSLAI